MIEDLGLDGLLPELLLERKGGVKLGTEPFCLEGMSSEGEEESRGHMGCRAGHDSAVLLEQCA